MIYRALLSIILCVIVEGAVKWSVQNSDNKTCLILEADDVRAELNAANVVTGTSTPINISFDNVINVGGDCDFFSNALEVSFFPGNSTSHGAKPWRLLLRFQIGSRRPGKSRWNNFFLADYAIEISPSASFNTTFQNFTSTTGAWDRPMDSSILLGYSCSSCTLRLSPDSTLNFKNVSAIAHVSLDTPELPKRLRKCSLDKNIWDYFWHFVLLIILFIAVSGCCVALACVRVKVCACIEWVFARCRRKAGNDQHVWLRHEEKQ